MHYTGTVYCMYSSKTRLKYYLVSRFELYRRKLTSQKKKKFFITTSSQYNDVIIINNLALPLANVPEHVPKYVIQFHLKKNNSETSLLMSKSKELDISWQLDTFKEHQWCSYMYAIEWYYCTDVLQAIVAISVHCYDNQYSWRDHLDIVSSLLLSD